MPRILMVIAPLTFRDEEYATPKEAFQAHGAEVVTASARPGTCTGKLGMTAEATLALSDADGAAFDAVVFVGGGGSEIYFDDPDAHRVAREAYAAGRVVAAICIAPSLLARAGMLDGIRATAFPSQERDLVVHGAIWTGDPVTVDPPFVTASGPEAATGFADAICTLLGI